MAGIDVKICGLTNRDDAAAARDLGADYLGFVLYAASPRGITGVRLLRILDKAGSLDHTVGVFVNETRQGVERLATDCGFCAVQLHGEERAEDFAGFPLPVWRAVWVKEDGCRPSPDAWGAARYVVDAAVPGLYGGSGVTADWTAAARVAEERPVMLAGGLTPANVGAAIRGVRPVGVDTASGVESVPGKKDHGRMRAFIEAAHEAGAGLLDKP